MAIGQVKVELVLDDQQFRITMTKDGAAITTFANRVNQANRSVQTMGRSMSTFGSQVRNFFISLALARSAMLNLWAITGQWQKSIIETSGELERMQMLLKGLSKAATEQEKLNDAQRDFNTIIQMSREAPFAVDAITDSFVKFKSAGIDPANGSLKSLLDAVAKFGGSDESLHRASVAIQQMAGKGVISMEELRQQLGEAVPTAMQMMARGMNMSMAELVKAISTGTVAARPALAKLFAEFDKAFGGSSQKMMNTYTGLLAGLKTQWTLFQNAIGTESGLFDEVKRQLHDLVTAMDPELVRGMARSIGEAMLTVMQAFIGTAKFIFKYREEIVTTMKVMGGFFLVMRVGVPAVMGLVTAFKAMRNAIIAIQLALEVRTMANAFASLSLVMGPVLAQMGAFALANPVTAILAITVAVVAGIAAWISWRDSIGQTSKKLDDIANRGYVDEKSMAEASEAILKTRDKVKELRQEFIEAGEARRIFGANTAYTKTKDSYLDEITEKLNLAAKAEENYTKIYNLRMKAIRSQEQGEIKSDLSAQLQEIEENFRRMDDIAAMKLETTSAKDKGAREAILKERVELLRKFGKDSAVAFNDAMEEIQKIANDNSDPERAKRYSDYLKGLSKDQFAFMAKNMLQIKQMLSPNELLESKDSGKPSKIEERIASIKARVAELKEEMVGGNGMAEKMKSLLDSGMFNSDKGVVPSDEQRRQLIDWATKLDQVERSSREAKEAQEALATTTSTLDRWVEQSAEELRQWQDQLDSGSTERADSRVRQFTKTVAALRATMAGTGQDMTGFDDKIKQITASLTEGAGDKQLASYRAEQKSLNMELITGSRARYEAERELARQDLESFIVNNDIKSEAMQGQLRKDLSLVEQLKDRLYEMQTPMGQMMERWKDFTGQMNQATAGWIDGVLDGLAELVVTGKASFGDLAKSIIKELIKIQMMKMIAGIAGMMTSPGVASTTQNLGGGDWTNYAPTPLANGGVFGSEGLRKYANGGIADRAQVAVFGEGDKPEAFVPLPDGRTIPVTLNGKLSGGGGDQQPPMVTVNVINQSGNAVSAEQGNMKFDGTQYVLDVVLKGLSRPGSFRDGMKSAMR